MLYNKSLFTQHIVVFMNPIILIQDQFLVDAAAARDALCAGRFSDIVNPMDGVSYPAINTEVPQALAHELVSGLQFLLGRRIAVRHLFARAMFAGMSATNKVHSDLAMGSRYASQLYLSDHWPDGSGTAFFAHKLHGHVHTERTPVAEIDCNDLDQFQRSVTVQACTNRLLVHRGDCWHLAEPIGGWGDRPENSRLVLTCFFDTAD